MDLDDLIPRWRGPLAGWFAARGADPGRAEELAGEVFVEAWLGRGRLRGDPADGAVFGAWLRGIARNLWRQERRRVRRTFQSLDGPAAGDPTDPGPGPMDAATRLAERDAVRTAVADLEPRLQEVVWMFYFDDATTKDVAALLETGEKTVEGRLYRARQALKGALAPWLETEVA